MILAWLVAATMRAGRRYRGWRWKRVARYVRRRDGHRCQKCGAEGVMLHVHHRQPVFKGGSHWPSNLVSLCGSCHVNAHGWDFTQAGRADR